MYQSIIVALDGSAEAEKILPYVETLAKSFSSVVLLISAIESPEEILAETAAPVGRFMSEPAAPVADPEPIISRERRDASIYLSTVADRLRAQGISVSYQHQEGPPAEAILAAAENNDADLIAMTTHARGGVGRFIYGSVADEVVRRSLCPILLVRLVDELAVTPLVETTAQATALEAGNLAVPVA